MNLINNIKVKFKTEDSKKLLENFVSLSGLQIASYILPLITLPYLVRVLGPEKYGLIAFTGAFVSYFQIFTSYGFNLSATREISIYRDDKNKISEIFSAVMIIKVLLMILSFILLSIIVFSIDQFRKEWIIYFFTFGMVVGNVLFPVWFFQGMEKMKYITVLNVFAQLIFTISIFIFIKNTSDYILVPLLSSSGFLVAGFLGLIKAIKDFDLKLKFPGFKSINHQLKEGWHVFISTISISFYANSNIFILGLFTNTVTVSFYAIAEKIIIAVSGLLTPLSQTIYPHISKIAYNDEKKGLKIINKTISLFLGFTFILSLLLFLFAGFIINLLFGNQYADAVVILRILAFLPLVIGLSNVFGILFGFAFGKSGEISRIQFVVGVFYPLLLIPMTFYFADIGTAVSFLLVEIIITILFYRVYRKHKESILCKM